MLLALWEEKRTRPETVSFYGAFLFDYTSFPVECGKSPCQPQICPKILNQNNITFFPNCRKKPNFFVPLLHNSERQNYLQAYQKERKKTKQPPPSVVFIVFI